MRVALRAPPGAGHWSLHQLEHHWMSRRKSSAPAGVYSAQVRKALFANPFACRPPSPSKSGK